jgi:hypothetical protein
MTKLSLCVAFTLLLAVNSIPSLVYAQIDEQNAQPGESPQPDNAAQPDLTVTPGDEESNETPGATDEPENQGENQSPQNSKIDSGIPGRSF